MLAFIIFRDRVTYARRCLSSLMAAGLEPVVVDHGTTFPPAVEWLKHLKKQGVQVIDVGGGRNPRSLWEFGWFRRMCVNDRYVVTDPDVIPSEDCPADWPALLGDILDRFPGYHKSGLSLRIDRIPVHYAKRDAVINWESRFWQHRLADDVFHADIDTTLAMHAPISQMPSHSFRALRTAPPYAADHVAWYEDFDHLTDEQRWYHEHADPGIVCWTLPGLGANDNLP
jgi:hypothetical protein